MAPSDTNLACEAALPAPALTPTPPALPLWCRLPLWSWHKVGAHYYSYEPLWWVDMRTSVYMNPRNPRCHSAHLQFMGLVLTWRRLRSSTTTGWTKRPQRATISMDWREYIISQMAYFPQDYFRNRKSSNT